MGFLSGNLALNKCDAFEKVFPAKRQSRLYTSDLELPDVCKQHVYDTIQCHCSFYFSERASPQALSSRYAEDCLD